MSDFWLILIFILLVLMTIGLVIFIIWEANIINSLKKEIANINNVSNQVSAEINAINNVVTEILDFIHHL